jgi:hypothetical protein
MPVPTAEAARLATVRAVSAVDVVTAISIQFAQEMNHSLIGFQKSVLFVDANERLLTACCHHNPVTKLDGPELQEVSHNANGFHGL